MAQAVGVQVPPPAPHAQAENKIEKQVGDETQAAKLPEKITEKITEQEGAKHQQKLPETQAAKFPEQFDEKHAKSSQQAGKSSQQAGKSSQHEKSSQQAEKSSRQIVYVPVWAWSTEELPSIAMLPSLAMPK